jgi:hypothetical protein
MCAGLAEIIAKAIRQGRPRLDAGADHCAIEFEFNLHCVT